MITSQLGFIEKLRDNFLTHKLFVDSLTLIDEQYLASEIEDDFVEEMPYKYFMDKFLMDYTCQFKAFNDNFIKKLMEDLINSCSEFPIIMKKFSKSIGDSLKKLNREHRRALKTAFNLNKDTNKDLCNLIQEYIKLLVPLELLDGDFSGKYMIASEYDNVYKQLMTNTLDKSVQSVDNSIFRTPELSFIEKSQKPKIDKIDLKGSHLNYMIPKLEILEFKARLGMHLETQKFNDEYDANRRILYVNDKYVFISTHEKTKLKILCHSGDEKGMVIDNSSSKFSVAVYFEKNDLIFGGYIGNIGMIANGVETKKWAKCSKETVYYNTIKRDHFNNLYIAITPNSIQKVFNVQKKAIKKHHSLTFHNIPGDRIQDYISPDGESIFVISIDGILSYYSSDGEFVTLIDMKLDSTEEVKAIAVSPNKQYIAVTYWNKSTYNSQIMFFRLKATALVIIGDYGFSEHKLKQNVNSFFLALSLDTVVNGYPILTAVQLFNEKKVFSFAFNDDDVVPLDTIDLGGDKAVVNSYYYGNEVYCVDNSLRLNKIKYFLK